jgi:hypothetical protein
MLVVLLDEHPVCEWFRFTKNKYNLYNPQHYMMNFVLQKMNIIYIILNII